MKGRFFNWLIIFLGSIALIGLCFTPALADDTELQDEAFGTNPQVTWIPAMDFSPEFGGGSWEPYLHCDGIEVMYDHGLRCPKGNYNAMVASVKLPSGVFLRAARAYYWDQGQELKLVFHLFKRSNTPPPDFSDCANPALEELCESNPDPEHASPYE